MISSEKIKQAAESYYTKVVEIRRHIHAYPELSFKEILTSEFISKELEKAGIKPVTIGDKGIIAIIKGLKPGNKTIGLRAEMDALPVTEENDLVFLSKKTGVMHACGHDLHIASLLGVAFILNDLKNDFPGSVKLIFQPAEEVLPGGAKNLIESGVLTKPDIDLIIGQHVLPELDSGQAGFRKGIYMASSDEIYIKIKGHGGHAAMPWKLVDPVLISAHLIVALQQIVSRNVVASIPSVLSFGKIDAAGSTNVIPDEVSISGTFRTFDENCRKDVHEKIKKITRGLASSMGGSAEIEIRKGYPVLINDVKLTERCMNFACEYLGKKNVFELDIRMSSDDFSYYCREKPSCYFRIGCNYPGNKKFPVLHNRGFIADEESLKTGVGLLTYITLNELIA